MNHLLIESICNISQVNPYFLTNILELKITQICLMPAKIENVTYMCRPSWIYANETYFGNIEF